MVDVNKISWPYFCAYFYKIYYNKSDVLVCYFSQIIQGVSVEAVDPVFQAKMLDMLKQTGR